MKISEIMTEDFKYLSPNTGAAEAMRTLLSMEISGLPVIEPSGKIVGMFTEKDILKSILPSYISQVGKFSYENSPKTVKSKAAKLSEFKVSDLMRREVVTVEQNTSVYEVAHIMLTQNVRRVPVVDRDNKMTGIVSRSDVLEAILKG